MQLISNASIFEYAEPVMDKAQVHVNMPPEVLVRVDIPLEVLKSFYLLPSLMYRLESLMLASQLRKELDFNSGSFHIPSSLVCLIIFFENTFYFHYS